MGEVDNVGSGIVVTRSGYTRCNSLQKAVT